MTTQSLDLNLIPKGISPRLYVSQYDKGQTWTFNIYAGNTAYTIPNGATVTIQGTKPDKTGFQYSCTASGNVVTATEQQQMTVIAGEVPAEIRITNNNEIIATLNFILVVEPAALTDETEISETDLPIIEQAIEMFPHYQEMIDDVSSDIATLSNVRAELGAHNLLPFSLEQLRQINQHAGAVWAGNEVTISGVKFTINGDGSVSTSGTGTNTGAWSTLILGELYNPKIGEKYKINGVPSGAPSSSYQIFVVARNSSGGALTSAQVDSTGAEITIPSGTVKVATYIRCYYNVNMDGKIFYPMIRLATDSDPTYQPYAKTNVELTKDDSGLTANAFENGAVNLFKPSMSSQVTNGVTYVVNDDYTISTSGTASEATMLSIGSYIYKAGRYKISGCPTGGSSNSYCLRCIAMKDGSPTWIKTVDDTGNGCELEIDGTTVDKINIAFIITNGTNMNGKVFKPMITVADMPNSDYAHYVPYCKSNKELTDEQYVYAVDETNINDFTGTDQITIPEDGLYYLGLQNNVANSGSALTIKLGASTANPTIASHRIAGNAYEKAEAIIPLKKGTVVTYTCNNTELSCQSQYYKFVY